MNKLSLVIILLLGTVLALDIVECRRFGGGFRGGGFRTRTGTSSGRRTSSFSSSSRRRFNAGYGTYSRRTPLPRTSLYTRNYGGFRGRRSSSYNGFGLGMGAGLFIGYRFGLLHRPIGYGHAGYGYNYIHRDRGYKRESPIRCMAANVSEYMKKSNLKEQEINIDEGEITCSGDEDVCYGRIAITEVNFTKSDNVSELQGFEVRIEKGCGIKTELEAAKGNRAKRAAGSVYDEERKCWTSSVTNSDSDLIDEWTKTDSFYEGGDVKVPRQLAESMGIEMDGIANVKISFQYESCLCDSGSFCNSAAISAITRIIVLISISIWVIINL